jgi:hypothetical protein
MDPNAALTFTLVERFLAPLLPRSTLGRIQPYLTQAQRTLEALPANALGRWPANVRVIHRGPPLRSPEILEGILDAVTRGLLEGRRLDVAYRSREQGDRLHCELNPLGLVVKGGLAYLVCTFWQYTDLRQVALHRVDQAAVLEAPAMVPKDFDLDRSMQEGAFAYPVGEPIHIEAVFSHGAHLHLRDTPLSVDQVLSTLDDEHVLVRAHRREHGRAPLVAPGVWGARGGVSPSKPPRRVPNARDGDGGALSPAHSVRATPPAEATRPVMGLPPTADKTDRRHGHPHNRGTIVEARREPRAYRRCRSHQPAVMPHEGREWLHHERISRLEQLERHIRERWQRILRWREAGTPEVGLFYVIEDALWLDSTPVPEARALREVIIQPGNHRSYWTNLRRLIRTLDGVPHDYYPRGRVVFVTTTGRYHLELGPELLTYEPLIRQVMEAMHLPTLQTDVQLAPHFRTRGFLRPACATPTGAPLVTPFRMQRFP